MLDLQADIKYKTHSNECISLVPHLQANFLCPRTTYYTLLWLLHLKHFVVIV